MNIEEDSDSLFGSPPPSPCRGRSPSLALPGADENVGTLTLPGSHNISEPAVNPTVPAAILHGRGSGPRGRPLKSAAREGKKKSKTRRNRSVTPQQRTPINLSYDPGKPLPRNFLRSQEMLLGLAGVIGGVKLSEVSRRRPGSSADNPIVIRDDVGSAGNQSKFSTGVSADIPAPSNEEIIASLINQGGIFPLVRQLHSLLQQKDVSSSDHGIKNDGEPTSDVILGDDSTSINRPSKRQKIFDGPMQKNISDPHAVDILGLDTPNHMAGKHMGRRLVVELARLVNEAAKGLMLKKHLKDSIGHRQLSDVSSQTDYYASGDFNSSSCSKLSSSNLLGNQASDSLQPISDSPMPSTPVDEPFFAAESFNTNIDLSAWPWMDKPDDLFRYDGLMPDSLQDDVEKWLADISLPGDQDVLAFPLSGSEVTDGYLPLANKMMATPELSGKDATIFENPLPAEPDITAMIDPILLSASKEALLSAPSQNLSFGTCLERAGPEATTFPRVCDTVNPIAGDGDISDSGRLALQSACSSSTQGGFHINKRIAIPSSKTISSFSVPNRLSPVFASTTSPPSFHGSSVSLSSIKSTPKSFASRAELLESAKMFRERLSEELRRAKIQLWETTIEQGVLIYLTKDKNL